LREWRNAALTGAFFFLGNHGLVSSAARFIPSGLASMIIATEVPIIAVLGSLLLPGRPLTGRTLWGAALGLCGVLALFTGKDTGTTHLFACAAVVGASICWSFGAVLSQKLAFPPDPVLRAGMQMACGGVMLTAASLLRGEPATIEWAAFSGRSLGALAYLIVFGSVITFACYSYLLKHVRAEAVATHVFVNPLVAVALGAWLAGEQLRPAHLVAGLFILVSVFVIISGRRAPASEAEVSPLPARPPSRAESGTGT
jgi:drug/metabolite transporter (DMT)-like permease